MGDTPMMPAMEKKMAIGFHAFPNPSVIKYIGPPCISPRLSRPRNITASVHSKYFVLTPRRAEIHIQNMAPGPPVAMATATPLMLPMPIVPAKAVESAS